MPKNIKLDQQLEFYSTLRELVLAYEEKYVRELEGIRNSVLLTRAFVVDLSEIFRELKTIHRYNLQFEKPQTSLNTSHETVPPAFNHFKSSIAVLLTGSHMFSGQINQAVFKEFADYINNNSTDIIIVGKIGRDLYRQSRLNKTFKYFDLPEEMMENEDITDLNQELLQYEKVNIFYGKFINIIDQSSTQSNISGDLPIEIDLTDANAVKMSEYLFEPSLEKIINFFENQIFRSLLKQTLNESLLSQVGSRLNTLESSNDRIEKKIKTMVFQSKKTKNKIKNKKQLQLLSSISFWANN